jgi:CBS domain-containing protein
MQIRNVMTKPVKSIAADDTIEQAARKMKHCNVGDLPVVVHNQAVGMVTDRDIVMRAVAFGLDPKETKVNEAMTKGVIVCKEEDDLEIVAQMMCSRQVRRLPVINRKGELMGIVSLGDLITKLEPSLTGKIVKCFSH